MVTVEDGDEGSQTKVNTRSSERVRKGESSGSSLGLYPIKKIAESYGGGAKAKDSELGGAEFEIALRKA